MDLKSSDKVVAVIGMKGSGKSSFIKTVMGRENIEMAELAEVRSYRAQHRMTDFVLVDTPWFNDTTRSYKDVLQQIEGWLTPSYRKGIRLTAILYMHHITDVHMQGSAMHNPPMFRELCGDANMRNVVLVTTQVGGREWGEERLRELRENVWGGMPQLGGRVMRYDGSLQSAEAILGYLVNRRQEAEEARLERDEDSVRINAQSGGKIGRTTRWLLRGLGGVAAWTATVLSAGALGLPSVAGLGVMEVGLQISKWWNRKRGAGLQISKWWNRKRG